MLKTNNPAVFNHKTLTMQGSNTVSGIKAFQASNI
jgi:hypothetical protein